MVQNGGTAMSSPMQTSPVSKTAFWAGCVVSAPPVLLLIMSGVMKLTQSEQVVEGFVKLGWDPSVAVGLGIVELLCALLYVVPQTAAVLGAILMTGYLGRAAIATHVRLLDYTSTFIAASRASACLRGWASTARRPASGACASVAELVSPPVRLEGALASLPVSNSSWPLY